MRNIVLSLSLTLCFVSLYGQKTTTRERDQDINTRPERTSLNDINKTLEQQETKTTVYYIALNVTQAASERNIKFEIEQGSTPEAPKKFASDLGTINRMASGRLNATHELDLINYMSAMGWEMVSVIDILTSRDMAIRQSKIYFKKSYTE